MEALLNIPRTRTPEGKDQESEEVLADGSWMSIENSRGRAVLYPPELREIGVAISPAITRQRVLVMGTYDPVTHRSVGTK